MKKKLLHAMLTISAVSLIASCGGGGGGDSSSTSATLQGQFVDAPVAGIEYTTSSGISGVTDENGYFNYKEGDTVTFKVGKIILGDAKADKVVTPSTLFADENLDETKIQEKVQQVVALLLALDSNPNDNKIEIPEKVKESLNKLNEEIHLEKEDLINTEIQVDIDGDGEEENLTEEVKNKEEEAKRHYSESLHSLVKEALKKLNGKKFHIEKHQENGDVSIDCDTCTLSYTGGDSFSFSCESGDTDSPSIVKDTNNGLVYILEGNGKKDLVISASDEKICLIPYDANPGEYICAVEGESSEKKCEDNNYENEYISYNLPTLQDFENFLSSINNSSVFIINESLAEYQNISVDTQNHEFTINNSLVFEYGELQNGLPYVHHKEDADDPQNPVPYVDSNVACADETGYMNTCIVKEPFFLDNSSGVKNSIVGMWKRYKFKNIGNYDYKLVATDNGSCIEFKDDGSLTCYGKSDGKTYYYNYTINSDGRVHVDTGEELIDLYVLEKIDNNKLFMFVIWENKNGEVTDTDFRIWEKVQTCD